MPTHPLACNSRDRERTNEVDIKVSYVMVLLAQNVGKLLFETWEEKIQLADGDCPRGSDQPVSTVTNAG